MSPSSRKSYEVQDHGKQGGAVAGLQKRLRSFHNEVRRTYYPMEACLGNTYEGDRLCIASPVRATYDGINFRVYDIKI